MIAIPVWLVYAMVALTVATAVYSYMQMRKMQKKNGQTANQQDGTIADEGATLSDISGSPHMYGNITHMWEQNTTPIKSKSGKK